MNSNYLRWLFKFQSLIFMISRLYFFIYCRRTNRCSTLKLIFRCLSTWYLLCCSPLPLRPFYRSCFCYYSWCSSLISFFLQHNNKPFSTKRSILNYISRCKLNLFPSTFSWLKWNTPTLLWLPRRLYFLKFYL